MGKYKYDAYCGLYCGACEMHVALKEGKLEDLAKKWDMEVSEITCHGCKSNVVFKWCRECNLKKCAREKGFEYCSECNEYPCEDLKKFVNDQKYPYHTEVLDNLIRIKKISTKNWLKEQKTRWSCPECGTEFIWYDMICSSCNSKLNGYERPSE